MKESKEAAPLLATSGNGSSHPFVVSLTSFTASSLGHATVDHTDVLVATSLVDQAVAMEGKDMLVEIVSMLVGLIRSNSPSRDA